MFARMLGPASLAVALAVATPTVARADFLFSWDYTNAGATIRRGDTPRGPQVTSGIPGQTPGVGGGSSLDSLVFTGNDLGFGRQGLLPGQGGQRGGARTGEAVTYIQSMTVGVAPLVDRYSKVDTHRRSALCTQPSPDSDATSATLPSVRTAKLVRYTVPRSGSQPLGISSDPVSSNCSAGAGGSAGGPRTVDDTHPTASSAHDSARLVRYRPRLMRDLCELIGTPLLLFHYQARSHEQ